MEICFFFFFTELKRLLLTRMKIIGNEFADVHTIDTTTAALAFFVGLYLL